MPYYSTHTGAQVDSAVDKINGLFDGSLTEAEKKAIGANIDLADNAQLTAELNRLAKAYAFGGVATPSTNPGTPTTNTFYIATEAGTYANMGGVELELDEVAAISWDGFSWRKDTLGIANESVINGRSYHISFFGQEAGAYDVWGGISWPAFYHTKPILLRGGDEVSVTTTSTGNISIFTEVNEEGESLRTIQRGVSGGSTTFVYKADKTILVSVSYIQKSSNGYVKRAGVVDSISKLVEMTDGGLYDFLYFGKNNGFFAVDGHFNESSGIYHTDPIHLNVGDFVSLTTRSTSYMSIISKTASDGSYIATLVPGDSSGSKTFEYEAAEECYIVVSFIQQDGYVQYLDIRSALNRISSLDNKRVTMLAIGASLTASNKWQYEVGNLINADVRTHALGGIGIVQMVDGTGTLPPISTSDVEDVDIVCLFGGFNDYRLAVNNLGDVSDMYPDQPTFVGRLNYAVKRIYEVAKAAGNHDLRVVLISPYNFGGGGFCDETGLTAGVKMLDGFKLASLRYSAELIDLLHNGQISEQNWDVFCAGAGTTNTTYLPYDTSAPYGTASVWPNEDLPTNFYGDIELVNGMLALVAADNSYGYTYSEWNDGQWTHGIQPGSSVSYPPYAYLWRDYIHLNDEGYKRIAKYIAAQLKPIK